MPRWAWILTPQSLIWCRRFPVNFALDNVPQELSLSLDLPDTLPSVFQLLLIEFFQEVNTVQYPLNNGTFNVLNILNVS